MLERGNSAPHGHRLVGIQGPLKASSADAGQSQGVSQLVVEFEPRIARQLSPWEKELLENESFFKGDAYLLVPPGIGPKAQKVGLKHVVSPKWAPELGMVHFKVDRSELWAGLIPDGISSPGMFNHFIGGTNLVAEKLY